jgi:hypothetical protein
VMNPDHIQSEEEVYIHSHIEPKNEESNAPQESSLSSFQQSSEVRETHHISILRHVPRNIMKLTLWSTKKRELNFFP